MFDIANNNGLPLLTIAMPVYNGGKYLSFSVHSLREQTFTNWELLIVDDGSADGAVAEIANLNDSRIQVLRDGKNKGLAQRLNECIDLAKGRYLARMDHDDVSYPERFMKQIAFLEANPTHDLLAVRAITIDEDDKPIGLFPGPLTHAQICAQPWRGFYLPHPAWMGRIEWFRQHRYTVPGPYFCEDQELLLRSYRTSSFATIDEVLFAYRLRATVNWEKLAKTRRTMLSLQCRHFLQSGQLHFALLAVATYVVKISFDMLKRVGISAVQSRVSLHDDAIISEWNAVLAGLQSKHKVV